MEKGSLSPSPYKITLVRILSAHILLRNFVAFSRKAGETASALHGESRRGFFIPEQSLNNGNRATFPPPVQSQPSSPQPRFDSDIVAAKLLDFEFVTDSLATCLQILTQTTTEYKGRYFFASF